MSLIYISGCGNIGYRHLQAVIGMQRPVHVKIIEPSGSARDKAKELVSQHSHVCLEAVGDIRELPKETPDLAIIATMVEHRREAFDKIMEHSAPRSLLLEKVLFTTTSNLQEVGLILENKNIPAWVNCGRRFMDIYQELRTVLYNKPGVNLAVSGANWGLCCNAVHFFDLVDYVLGDTLVSLSAEGLEKQPIKAKRQGCIELYGTLKGVTATGGTVTLSCSRDQNLEGRVRFYTDNESWSIDEKNEGCVHEKDGAVVERKAIKMIYVSMLSELYSSILDTNTSILPLYKLSAQQHQLFIDTLRSHLGISIEEDVVCPIS